MNRENFPATVIHGTIGHLQKFIGQSTCTDRIQFFLSDLHHHVPAEVIIDFSLFPAHLHFHTVIDTFRHIQIIHGFHRNTNIRDQGVDRFLRSLTGFVTVNNLPVPFIRCKEPLPVPGDKPSQPLSHIQQIHLGPEIQKGVGSRCPSQADHPVHQRAHLFHGFEPLCLIRFKTGKFINDHRIKIPMVILNQPADIFTINNV